MARKTVLIVPATVPTATVVRREASAHAGPAVTSVAPSPVPAAHTTRLFPEQLTAEEVEQLRQENAVLREELARVRAS